MPFVLVALMAAASQQAQVSNQSVPSLFTDEVELKAGPPTAECDLIIKPAAGVDRTSQSMAGLEGELLTSLLNGKRKHEYVELSSIVLSPQRQINIIAQTYIDQLPYAKAPIYVPGVSPGAVINGLSQKPVNAPTCHLSLEVESIRIVSDGFSSGLSLAVRYIAVINGETKVNYEYTTKPVPLRMFNANIKNGPTAQAADLEDAFASAVGWFINSAKAHVR